MVETFLSSCTQVSRIQVWSRQGSDDLIYINTKSSPIDGLTDRGLSPTVLSLYLGSQERQSRYYSRG